MRFFQAVSGTHPYVEVVEVILKLQLIFNFYLFPFLKFKNGLIRAVSYTDSSYELTGITAVIKSVGPTRTFFQYLVKLGKKEEKEKRNGIIIMITNSSGSTVMF